MPSIRDEYLADVRALPWAEVLTRLGIRPPSPPETGACLYMRCTATSWRGHPDRREKTPSLRFHDSGRFHCFSCGAAGDVFSYVLRMRETGSHNPDRLAGAAMAQRRLRAYRGAIRFFKDEFGLRTGGRGGAPTLVTCQAAP